MRLVNSTSVEVSQNTKLSLIYLHQYQRILSAESGALTSQWLNIAATSAEYTYVRSKITRDEISAKFDF